MTALLDNSYVKFSLTLAAIFVVMNILKSLSENMEVSGSVAQKQPKKETARPKVVSSAPKAAISGDNHVKLPKNFGSGGQVTPKDLLPEDRSASVFVSNNRATQALADKNFLVAGNHVGINTIGSSLRNANLQLRSDPPNPQTPTGPWQQSTITPSDTQGIRRPMEIGI